MPLPACIRVQGAEVLLAIKLQPRAGATEIGPVLGNELKVKVTAPPVDAAANEGRLLTEPETGKFLSLEKQSFISQLFQKRSLPE